jgi:Cys-tRNA(Pro)/Cys-tRNA(Cys) deacylase
MKKTNAARILDRLNLPYTLHEYAFDEEDLAAEKAAAALNLPEEQVFKTLLARGDKTGPCFFVVPANLELDPKAAAQASGNKHVEMVALKEVQPLTGYIRGGVSPLGAKKAYPVFLHETADLFPFISVSAGQRGCQLWLKTRDLLTATGGKLCAIAREHPKAEG